MKKALYHYKGAIYQVKTYLGKEHYSPIAFDDEGNLVTYDIWRYAYKRIDFEWSICRYLNKRYHKDLTPLDIYLCEDKLTVTM